MIDTKYSGPMEIIHDTCSNICITSFLILNVFQRATLMLAAVQ